MKSVAKYAGDKAEKCVEKAIESEKVFKEIKSLIVKGQVVLFLLELVRY